MDARCQMQERGEKGDEPWSPPPDAATQHWLLATGRRKKLIKTGFQTLTDDNISARPCVAPGPGFDLAFLFRPGRVPSRV